MATPELSVADHLKKVTPAVRPTVLAARRTVKAAAPRAKEVAYQSKPPRTSSAMWKLARYALNDTYVVGLGTFPRHATLFFYRGRELDDGSGLLKGSGKDTRFVTLNTSADAERPAVKRLVRRAFALESGQSSR